MSWWFLCILTVVLHSNDKLSKCSISVSYDNHARCPDCYILCAPQCVCGGGDTFTCYCIHICMKSSYMSMTVAMHIQQEQYRPNELRPTAESEQTVFFMNNLIMRNSAGDIDIFTEIWHIHGVSHCVWMFHDANLNTNPPASVKDIKQKQYLAMKYRSH